MTGESAVAQFDAMAARVAAQPGKYLTFQLGSEVYGLEILKVQEIIGVMNVTRVPRMPEFVRGVINLRGRVIPVVDLRLKFGMADKEYNKRTCIIVVQVGYAGKQVTMGVIVDEVSEVLDVRAEQLEGPPSFGASVDTEFLLGMAKVGDKVVILLDVDKVLATAEVALLQQAAQRA